MTDNDWVSQVTALNSWGAVPEARVPRAAAVSLDHADQLNTGLRQQRAIQVTPSEGVAAAATKPDADLPGDNRDIAAAIITSHPKAAAAAKRTFDILASVVALIVLTPLLFLIVVLIKIGSPGPVFYRWHVVGRHGKAFVGYKFRSMYTGADELREELSSQNENSGPFFKIKNDPRVTPVGRMLRKFSLDELPQLWSVLKGDMSLVGPRPAQTFEYEQLEEWHKARVGVKPGCTSAWIVSGKTSDFDRMVQIDLDYIANWTLLLDLRILCQTAIYLLAGRNN